MASRRAGRTPTATALPADLPGVSRGPVSLEATSTAGDDLQGRPPDETDNANYFCEYAYIYHQMDMLEDSHRTGAYFDAIMSNPGCFEGKSVLDVGAGTCILSVMAARAGAKMIYAVEATDMAERGRRIVEANGLGDVIRVVQGTLETAKVPEKVDIIVSEWMGYFLLRESMLDTVLVARDKYLKPGGAMFPSHATLYLAPVSGVKALKAKWQAWEGEVQHWNTFSADMRRWYEMDFGCVRDDFMTEQKKYYLQTGAFVNLTPKQLIGPAKPLLELDLLTVTLDEMQSPKEPQKCILRIVRDGDLEGFCGYFDAFFRGSPGILVEQESTLTTAPTTGVSTHWGQQVFGFFPPMKAKRGDMLECHIWIRRQERNHRLLAMECNFTLYTQSGGERAVKETRDENFYID